jgi:hypothetical protein
MRALFPMYDQPFQFVALPRSGITTVAQFNNRNVGVGPRAGTGGVYIPAILAAIGISAKIGNGSWDDSAARLLEGGYDALGMSAGIPIPALKHVEAKEPVVFVSLTPEQSARRYRNLRSHRSVAELIRPWTKPILQSGYIFLRLAGTISRMNWFTNWSKQSSRTSLALLKRFWRQATPSRKMW